jgi:hypothetical protein
MADFAEPLYFIKPFSVHTREDKPIMTNIYWCCIGKYPIRPRIHSKGSSTYIDTNIQFTPLPKTDDANVLDMLSKMNCHSLNHEYIAEQYNSEKCMTLLRFHPGLTSLHSFLTFTFNRDYHCIEVVSFCSDERGGGTLFNFLINAVKCSLSKCKTPYERQIILSPLENSIGFYEKYGFMHIETDDKLLQRHLSMSSDPTHTVISLDDNNSSKKIIIRRELDDSRSRSREKEIEKSKSRSRDRRGGTIRHKKSKRRITKKITPNLS